MTDAEEEAAYALRPAIHAGRGHDWPVERCGGCLDDAYAYVRISGYLAAAPRPEGPHVDSLAAVAADLRKAGWSEQYVADLVDAATRGVAAPRPEGLDVENPDGWNVMGFEPRVVPLDVARLASALLAVDDSHPGLVGEDIGTDDAAAREVAAIIATEYARLSQPTDAPEPSA